MSEEKVTSTFDKYWWIGVLTFFVVLIALSTWKGIADKQYIASLSPAERAELKLQEQQKAEEQKIQDDKNAKGWADLFNSMFTNPLWMFVWGVLIGYLLTKVQEGMSYY